MTSSKGVASINCCSPIGDRLVLNQSRSGLVKLWDHIVLTDLDLLQSRPSQMGPKDPIGMGDAIYNEVHRPRFHFTEVKTGSMTQMVSLGWTASGIYSSNTILKRLFGAT